MAKSEKTFKWLKYRWEFMRRNKEYRRDFESVLEIRKKHKGGNGDYWLSPEAQQEKQYCEKWELKSSQMFNPEYSFEELIERGTNPDKGRNPLPALQSISNVLNRWLVIKAFQSDAVQYFNLTSRESDKKYLVDALTNPTADDFFIHIDFSKINSIENLISSVSKLLRDKHNFPGSDIIGFKDQRMTFGEKNGIELIMRKRLKRKRLNSVNFDRYLRVGDMRENGMSFPQIAKEIFPDAFDDKNEPIGYYDPENARKKTEAFYKKYQELVNHGYKKILYP
jgi:hypothetical protein